MPKAFDDLTSLGKVKVDSLIKHLLPSLITCANYTASSCSFKDGPSVIYK